MNAMLAMFYSDVMGRYFRSSPFYQDAKQEWAAVKGRNWDAIDSAAFVLAEREGYLSFLYGLRLGILLGTELDELAPLDF